MKIVLVDVAAEMSSRSHRAKNVFMQSEESAAAVNWYWCPITCYWACQISQQKVALFILLSHFHVSYACA